MVKSMNFKEERIGKITAIEQILKKYLPVKEGLQKEIMEAMEYSLLAGGKRLRPMLMRETYVLFGGDEELIEPFMAAIEMIHTYSLVHDDLRRWTMMTTAEGERLHMLCTVRQWGFWREMHFLILPLRRL